MKRSLFLIRQVNWFSRLVPRLKKEAVLHLPRKKRREQRKGIERKKNKVVQATTMQGNSAGRIGTEYLGKKETSKQGKQINSPSCKKAQFSYVALTTTSCK